MLKKEMIDLALQFGGYTNLDCQYLNNLLEGRSKEEALTLITPPPSVLNAYFAEIYQKQGPQSATDYYFTLSQALDLREPHPSFEEKKPFVRLNLSGSSYGFSYPGDQEIALVFSESPEADSLALLFELATIFPHYWVYKEEGQVRMSPRPELPSSWSKQPSDYLLTEVEENENYTHIWGPNYEEIIEAAAGLVGQAYYASDGKIAHLYLSKK